jgi:hypothetical protein
MPSLEEVMEAGVAAANRCVEESRAIDYAWAMDTIAGERGAEPHYLHNLIERQYEKFLGELYGGNP